VPASTTNQQVEFGLGASKSKDQTERLKEVKKEKVRERKGRGGNPPQTLSFRTPHLYLCYLIFYWLIIQQNMIFMIKHSCSFFARSSSFRNNLASSRAPIRSVNRYDGRICFCASALSPAPLVIPSCTVIEPTAQYLYHCASTLSVTVWSEDKPCTPCQ
jgi:hypothetical protein